MVILSTIHVFETGLHLTRHMPIGSPVSRTTKRSREKAVPVLGLAIRTFNILPAYPRTPPFSGGIHLVPGPWSSSRGEMSLSVRDWLIKNCLHKLCSVFESLMKFISTSFQIVCAKNGNICFLGGVWYLIAKFGAKEGHFSSLLVQRCGNLNKPIFKYQGCCLHYHNK